MAVPRSSLTLRPGTPSAPVRRASRSAPEGPVDERLPRQLGFWSTTALTIGLIIGAGIFRASSAVAASAGSVSAIVLVWIAGGAVALCGALSVAELGAMFPRAGGIYVFLREGYGRSVAFLWGWTALVLQPASIGVLALVFAEYLGNLVALGAHGIRLVAASAILLAAAASYRSTRFTSGLQGAATAAKLLALAGIVALAFALGDGGRGAFAASGAPAPAGTAAPFPGGAAWSRYGVALIAALWPYGGWQNLAYMAGEVREPARTFPRALIAGMATVLVVYLAANAAYLYVLPIGVVAHSPLVAADVVLRVIGPTGSALISALVMVSAFGTLIAGMLVFPRLYYAVAADGLAVRQLASVHPRHRTPHAAVVFLCIAAMAMVALRGVDQLRELTIVGAWPFLALAVLAVPVLRHRRPDAPRPYRTFGYPAVPIVFLAASLALVGSAVIAHPGATLATFAYTLLGLPVYVAVRAAARRRALA